jgi:hypothetical protein
LFDVGGDPLASDAGHKVRPPEALVLAAGETAGVEGGDAGGGVIQVGQTAQRRQKGRLPILPKHKRKRAVKTALIFSLFGGAREDRTPDLLNAIQALSHLSYDPAGEKHRAMGGAMPGY